MWTVEAGCATLEPAGSAHPGRESSVKYVLLQVAKCKVSTTADPPRRELQTVYRLKFSLFEFTLVIDMKAHSFHGVQDST